MYINHPPRVAYHITGYPSNWDFVLGGGALTSHLTYWSFERKTCTWRSPKSSYFMKFGGFHKIWRISADFMKSTCKPYKSNNSRKTLQFYGVQWEGYVSGFHEICRISRNERPITRNGKAYVFNHVKSAGFRKTNNCQEW